MKPPIDHSSVKLVDWMARDRQHEKGRLGFELVIRPGAVRSRPDVVRLLIRRMIAHLFTFDAGAYVISVRPVAPGELE